MINCTDDLELGKFSSRYRKLNALSHMPKGDTK